MKSIAALAAALVAAVSAAPLEVRQATGFQISSFSANTLPHGTAAFISFDVTIANTDVSTRCSYSDQTSVGHLPDVTPFRACDNAAVEWQFREQPSRPGTEGPFLLVVRYEDPVVGHKVAGFKEWTASEFPIENQGSTTSQAYRGAPEFAVPLDQ